MTLFRKSRSKGDLQQEFQTTVRFLDDSEPIQSPFTVSLRRNAFSV